MSGSVILRLEDDYLVDLIFPAYFFILKGEEIYDDKGI